MPSRSLTLFIKDWGLCFPFKGTQARLPGRAGALLLTFLEHVFSQCFDIISNELWILLFKILVAFWLHFPTHVSSFFRCFCWTWCWKHENSNSNIIYNVLSTSTVQESDIVLTVFKSFLEQRSDIKLWRQFWHTFGRRRPNFLRFGVSDRPRRAAKKLTFWMLLALWARRGPKRASVRSQKVPWDSILIDFYDFRMTPGQNFGPMRGNW